MSKSSKQDQLDQAHTGLQEIKGRLLLLRAGIAKDSEGKPAEVKIEPATRNVIDEITKLIDNIRSNK